MHARFNTGIETESTSPRERDRRVTSKAALTHETLLELAFRAVRDDPPAASEAELAAKRRLRETLLEAAVTQFEGCSNGLVRRVAADGALRLRAPSNSSHSWCITYVDRQGMETELEKHTNERAAIRALIVATTAAAQP